MGVIESVEMERKGETPERDRGRGREGKKVGEKNREGRK